ncbi:extracellular solute-binding protein [Halococcus saccharolyticus]|uniref:Sulfate/thiosulfate/molybdate ABC transporter substrate-binding protein n=1 Tax=Halococcus saccharolyticus DSM 5350 TaxID=1227455 RepID=M0MEY2_9EURY|nr:extracellular solute-binding protein [Halococcus saccharolyticus]EMA43898.1 sulfate/thiosulfate/molybdate ABC transporter substrate-binding protein [Halococcus saccharolyticus DSM 5350]
MGFTGVAGCVGSGRESGGGGTSASIAILSAGSLQNALANGLKPTVDVPVTIESHGSTTVARMIAEGKRDPDIVSVADVALFDEPLSPSWHSVFTSNAVVLAYNPNTEGGQRLADAGRERWYEPLAKGAIDLGRTDPKQDPLGYRTLFALELASRYYDDASNLKDRILENDQLYPETALISQFETGSIDAAIAYRSMAVERGYEYIDLPNEIDLSNPQYDEEWYSTVSYSLPSGQEIQGGPISYGSTIRRMSDAALEVFDAHTTGSYLDEHGFLRREQFPTFEGAVPERVTRAVGRTSGASASANQPDNRSGATQSVNQSRQRTAPVKLSSAVSDITVLH